MKTFPEKYTLKMFMEDYEDFDWEKGTIVLIPKTGTKSYIITKDSPWKFILEKYINEPVWNWNHNENVMVITLFC